MAATRLIALHANKGKTIACCLNDSINYILNPCKTENREYVSSYECEPETAAEEFLLSKRQYQHITGRTQESNVVAFQIRQSFKPGEITPEEANKVGYELAMSFTKGKHAFIVATHTDRAHIHNHIIFNSTSLDCTKKFRDFFLSGIALQKVSDRICLEHNLSVIDPQPYGERKNQNKYLKRPSKRDDLCRAIDEAMEKEPKDFSELVEFLKAAGYEYKGGKQPAFRYGDQGRFIRLSSLEERYSEDGIQARLKASVPARKRKRNIQTHEKEGLNVLINIQEKLNQGKGPGYERWARLFNLKQMANTMCFLKEQGFTSYEELVLKSDETAERFHELSDMIKESEERLKEIAELKKQIINYVKTRETYVKYREAGYSQKFYEAHSEEIILHKAAKGKFSELGIKKLPKVKELNEEYGKILEEKRKAYGDYRALKKEMQEYMIARKTVETILEIDSNTRENDVEREKENQEKKQVSQQQEEESR